MTYCRLPVCTQHQIGISSNAWKTSPHKARLISLTPTNKQATKSLTFAAETDQPIYSATTRPATANTPLINDHLTQPYIGAAAPVNAVMGGPLFVGTAPVPLPRGMVAFEPPLI